MPLTDSHHFHFPSTNKHSTCVSRVFDCMRSFCVLWSNFMHTSVVLLLLISNLIVLLFLTKLGSSLTGTNLVPLRNWMDWMYSRIEIHIDRGAAPPSVTMIGNNVRREGNNPKPGTVVQSQPEKVKLSKHRSRKFL